jgi:hypothetical protein
MVTEETVEASWQEVGALSPERAHQHMMQLGERQPELLAFITTMTETMSEAAQETAIYAFVVICHMFESSSPKPLPRAKHRKIAAAYERISEQLGRLITADDHFLERHAMVTTGREPFVMRYVSEILLEPDDPEEKLADEEIGETFMYLQTIVDVLHEISATG